MRHIKSTWVSELSSVAKAAIISAIVSILAGTIAFMETQDIGFVTSLYWAMTTAATVGYGDVTPKDTTGQVIAILVMVTAIPSLAAVFSLITSEIVHKKNKKHIAAEFEKFGKKIKEDL